MTQQNTQTATTTTRPQSGLTREAVLRVATEMSNTKSLPGILGLTGLALASKRAVEKLGHGKVDEADVLLYLGMAMTAAAELGYTASEFDRQLDAASGVYTATMGSPE